MTGGTFRLEWPGMAGSWQLPLQGSTEVPAPPPGCGRFGGGNPGLAPGANFLQASGLIAASVAFEKEMMATVGIGPSHRIRCQYDRITPCKIRGHSPLPATIFHYQS